MKDYIQMYVSLFVKKQVDVEEHMFVGGLNISTIKMIHVPMILVHMCLPQVLSTSHASNLCT